MEQKKSRFPYNIVLIGFMGAGKSTVADYLKDQYDMKLVEMDQEIADREKMSIPEIFSTHGELYFRNLETQLLKELQFENHCIISCGGGVALRQENVEEMRKNGRVVLLTANPQTIYDRVKDSENRPILKGNNNIEFISKLMDERRPKYEAAADVVIHTDNKSVVEICEELIKKITEMDEK